MRKFILNAVFGIAALGVTVPTEAKASWLSEALNNTHIQLNIGSQYPVYGGYAVAPVPQPIPAYPVYAPVQTYAAPVCYPTYRPVPVYAPAPVLPVQAYRPVPVPPQHSYHGPNHNGYGDRFDWRR